LLIILYLSPKQGRCFDILIPGYALIQRLDIANKLIIYW